MSQDKRDMMAIKGRSKINICAIFMVFLGELFFLTSCSPWKLLFRRESLNELKSNSYSVAKINNEWDSLRGSEADLAYWSKETGSIISINSICRPERQASLTTLKQSILSVIEKPKIQEQREGTLDGRKAVFTTVEGTVDGVPVKIRHIVMNKNFCTYDLMMSAHPDYYSGDLAAFNSFVESFHAD